MEGGRILDIKGLEIFSKKIAENSFGGMFIGLKGDLGAGKTQFTKFLVKNLNGNIEDVVSPTFTILNEYNTEKFKIYHFDLYRLNSIDELEEIGYKDFFYDDNAITLVEWIDRIPKCLPDDYLLINFEFTDDVNRRKLNISYNGERYNFIRSL